MSLDLASGKTVWTRSFPTPYTANSAAVRFGRGPRSTPVVAEGTACFLGVDSRFSCHDAASGEELWVRDFSEKSGPEESFCGSALSPLVDGGVVFVHLGDDRAGRFFAADLRTGKELWGWEGQGPGYASPLLLEIDGKPVESADDVSRIVTDELLPGQKVAFEVIRDGDKPVTLQVTLGRRPAQPSS